MNNSLLIADQDSRCGKKITDIFLLNEYKVIQTVVNKNPSIGQKETEEEKSGQKLIRLDWNCFSTISPKNIILQTKQSTEFNTAAIIFSPPEAADSFINQSHIEIQKSIDFYFRSLITITKEIINELRKKSPAYLYLVLNSKNRDEMYSSIYRSFINSVLRDTEGTLYINGVENNYENPEQFAEYFYNLLIKEKKTGGKWYRQLQMNSFFSIPGKQ